MMNFYDIWFSRVEISNRIKLELMEKFEVSQIWNLDYTDLEELGLKEITIRQILEKTYREKLEQYENYLEKNKIELITLKDKEYPDKLKNIPDMPAYIFIKGNKEILDDESVAIIGSRMCTEDGKKIAFNTAKELGDKNINVISGLALRNRYLCA